MSFKLTQEPWIPVVSPNFQVQEVSLIKLFETWEDTREIQADNPPTTLAIYRLLLAILHQAYQGPRDEEHWDEIYEDDGQQAINYLREQEDCFDLLHPERPFMQDKTLTVDQGAEIYQAYALHGNNTSTVFCHEHQWSGSLLTMSEAARLVLRLHLFDAAGRKTGTPVSARSIPTMNVVNVVACGKSLKETLLLNLMQYSPEDEIPCATDGEDLPVWERKDNCYSERIPNGYIDYLTYRWRRVKLFLEGDDIIKVAFQGGDHLPKNVPPSQWECGVPYKKLEKAGKSQQIGIRLDLRRSLWRDSDAILQSSGSNSCPRIVNWIAKLKSDEELIEKGLIEEGKVHLKVFGLSVDQSKPLGWVSEQFSVPIDYLKEKQLQQALVKALETAEKHQKTIFGGYRGSPYQALAKILNHPDASCFAKSLDGESRYWANLDRKFQELLLPLSKDSETGGDETTIYGNRELPDWTKKVQRAARDAFTESIQSIRNYQARAIALKSLNYHLARLRGEKIDKKETKKS